MCRVRAVCVCVRHGVSLTHSLTHSLAAVGRAPCKGYVTLCYGYKIKKKLGRKTFRCAALHGGSIRPGDEWRFGLVGDVVVVVGSLVAWYGAW